MTERKHILNLYNKIWDVLDKLTDLTIPLEMADEHSGEVVEVAWKLLNLVEDKYSITSTEYPGGLEDWAAEEEEE